MDFAQRATSSYDEKQLAAGRGARVLLYQASRRWVRQFGNSV